MYAIVSSNSNLSIVVFGPFDKMNTAKEARKRLKKKFPTANHLLVKLNNMAEVYEIDPEDRTCLSS